MKDSHIPGPRGHHTGGTAEDPYYYQQGFGNRFATEAIPGVLPQARNAPQRVKYDLFSEQLNGSAFVAPRACIQNVWMYRVFPSVAHSPVRRAHGLNDKINSCFSPLNHQVEYTPADLSWAPFPMVQSGSVDFVQGLRTIGGNGDPTLKEGLAVHIYSANASMQHSAFCNNDGDMLILPQQGRLDIQTEMGRLMVRPGELGVVQAGIRFKVSLPDGPSRGYIQEVFGAHWELPELGPFGSNGMAYPRDFEVPIASFDLDTSTQWQILYKVAGQLHSCSQNHTPFDVVAWHGNYAPYKYDISKFVNTACVEKEQADPTIYCILTARSKVQGISICDFLAFTQRWMTTSDTFRPPYYHRNMSTEVMGLIHGKWGGSAPLEPGGLTYEGSFMPHGESYDTWKSATTRELVSERVMEGVMAFMMHMSVPILLTKWAREESGCLHETEPERWSDMRAHFEDHLEEVNADLAALGREQLVAQSASLDDPVATNGYH